MSIRKAVALISGRRTTLPTADRLTNVGAVWVGTTRREKSEMDEYFSSGTTDANGRIVFNLTTDGTASGPAIFSSVTSVNAICVSSSTNISLLPSFFVELVSANQKQVTIRGISSQSGLVILGIGISQVAFVGAGITGRIGVWGLPT